MAGTLILDARTGTERWIIDQREICVCVCVCLGGGGGGCVFVWM